MNKILVVFYSQSGDVQKMAQALLQPLQHSGQQIVWETLRPIPPYPFPWRNVHRFFNVMPECILGDPPSIETPQFDLGESFDLVVIAYQVWFLSPSLPIQAFFRSAHSAVLKNRPVITVSVSRNMWQQASIAIKNMLRRTGAQHVGNIVVTHQGPDWSTFITTPRRLLTGKKDRTLGLPEAGVHQDEQRRLNRLGKVVADRLLSGSPLDATLLQGRDAVRVQSRNVVPELVARRAFGFWARFIRLFGKPGNPLRHIGLFFFIVSLLFAIVIGLPLIMLATLVLRPLIGRKLRSYVAQLQEPSGSSLAA